MNATPLAARMAALAGLDLASFDLNGGGPITRANIVARIAPAGRRPAIEGEVLEALPDSWAARLARSKRSLPHFYQTVECKLDALLALQTELSDANLQLVDFVVLALARVLRQMPVANARWSDAGMVERASIDIGVSNGMTSSEPLVIGEADRIGLRGIAAARSAPAATGGVLSASFVLLDMSALGIDQAGAIVDPLNAGVLTMGAVREQAVVEQGTVKIARTMRCTLSGDHRLIDGAAGAQFLAELRQRLENPVSLLL
jgi:pyruvate dehydrogenase E2 component (dihydrolipoamide acetyltransferase)